jgi:glycosyltransferase involved in cell wall biosynthesis
MGRIAELTSTCAFVQLEEIGSAQYFRAAAARAPTIASLHNVDSQVLRMNIRQARRPDVRDIYHWARMAYTERRVARAARAVLCVSGRDRDYFASHRAQQALLVPNGVDDDLLKTSLGLGEPERVLFFGTFGWKPNDDGVRRFIVESWPLVRAERPDACLRVAGGGAQAAVGDLAGTPGVEVVGFVDDLTSEISAARVVIAPLWVGGGTRIKVLEALAAGRPVVGTAVGVEQIGFVHERDGLIADTTAGLAEATIRILADDSLAASLGSSGRQLAEHFRWTRVTEPAEALYRQLADGQAAKGADPG